MTVTTSFDDSPDIPLTAFIWFDFFGLKHVRSVSEWYDGSNFRDIAPLAFASIVEA